MSQQEQHTLSSGSKTTFSTLTSHLQVENVLEVESKPIFSTKFITTERAQKSRTQKFPCGFLPIQKVTRREPRDAKRRAIAGEEPEEAPGQVESSSPKDEPSVPRLPHAPRSTEDPWGLLSSLPPPGALRIPRAPQVGRKQPER